MPSLTQTKSLIAAVLVALGAATGLAGCGGDYMGRTEYRVPPPPPSPEEQARKAAIARNASKQVVGGAAH